MPRKFSNCFSCTLFLKPNSHGNKQPSNIRWLWTITAPQTAQPVTGQAFHSNLSPPTYSNFVKSCKQEASCCYAHSLCGWAVTAAKDWRIQQMCSPHAKHSLCYCTLVTKSRSVCEIGYRFEIVSRSFWIRFCSLFLSWYWLFALC